MSQAEIPEEFAFQSGMGLFSRINKVVKKVPLSENEFVLLLKTCNKYKVPMGLFVAEAVREKLECQNFPVHELDNAQLAVRSLFRLITDHFDSIGDERVDNIAEAKVFGVGLLALIVSTEKNLSRAIGSAVSALRPGFTYSA